MGTMGSSLTKQESLPEGKKNWGWSAHFANSCRQCPRIFSKSRNWQYIWRGATKISSFCPKVRTNRHLAKTVNHSLSRNRRVSILKFTPGNFVFLLRYFITGLVGIQNFTSKIVTRTEAGKSSRKLKTYSFFGPNHQLSFILLRYAAFSYASLQWILNQAHSIAPKYGNQITMVRCPLTLL